MNRKTLTVLAVPVILLFAAACERQPEQETGTIPPAQETPSPAVTQPSAATMSADIKGVGSEGANIRGKVEVLGGETGTGTYLLSVMMQGVPPGDHAWHIHKGKCDVANAPVVVPLSEAGNQPALTGPMTVAADSTFQGTVSIPSNKLSIEQLRSDDYSLRVHSKAGPDQGPIIACADL